MASINDVFNQLITVNATLSGINSSVNAGTTATNGVKTAVNQLDTDLKAGFASTVAVLNQISSTLNIIAALDLEAVKMLFHMTQQNDTMICALEHISQNTCAIHTQAQIQTGLQTEMRDDIDGLMTIAAAAYPAAALDRAKLAELRAEIHKCCPPDKPRPACSYEPCPKPKTIGPPKLPRLPTGDQPGPATRAPK